MKIQVTGRGIRRPATRIAREFNISRREAVALKHKKALNVKREIGDALIAAGLAVEITLPIVTPEDDQLITTPEDSVSSVTLEIEGDSEKGVSDGSDV